MANSWRITLFECNKADFRNTEEKFNQKRDQLISEERNGMQPYLFTHIKISCAFFIKRVDKEWNNQRKLIWIENHLRGPDFNRKHGTSIPYLLLNWEEVDG